MVLLASHSHSLKEKRSVVRRIKDRTRARFDVSMAEVGGQDTWQRIVLGFSIVGSDRKWVETSMAKVIGFVDSLGLAELGDDEREILHYGDERLGGADRSTEWVPPEWTDADDDGADEPSSDRDGAAEEEGDGE